jgi:anaerobic selenocysteine-containing dehydrogenase
MMDSYEMTLHKMQGAQGTAGFDVENSDFILSFGSGIIDGWGSPVRMFRANSALKKNEGSIVQVEPRLSNTAAKSDSWVPVKPGTETALALGIAQVIIKENLYNSNFVDTYTNGFQAFKQLVMNDYSPDRVAEITGLKRSTVVSIARKFAQASSPLAICGKGQGKTPGSMNEFMAVHALNALVGNINKEGGVWTVQEPEYINWSDAEMDDVASMGMQMGRLDGAGSDRYPDSRYLLNRFFDIVNSGKGYPIEALLVAGANPCYSMPDKKAVASAFEKIPYVVSFSSYLDETAMMADIILPNHNYLERYEDRPFPAGLQKPGIGLLKPVVDPQFNTKHVGDTFILIAQALGGTIGDALSWDSYEACLEETLEDKWDSLLEEGFWVDEEFSPATWDESFDTDSGKFEFASDGYNPVLIEGDEGTYPLTLIPYDSMRLASGYIGNPPFLTKTVEDTVLKGNTGFVEINPKTAGKLGLREGNTAKLTTPKGTVKVKAHLFEGIMPGLVALPRGLGHSAYDKYIAGKGVNFNELIGPVEDPVSGLDAAWGIRAKLSRA